jgi:5S rRNA maturation endonuclease (ribonuclease M5)
MFPRKVMLILIVVLNVTWLHLFAEEATTPLLEYVFCPGALSLNDSNIYKMVVLSNKTIQLTVSRKNVRGTIVNIQTISTLNEMDFDVFVENIKMVIPSSNTYFIDMITEIEASGVIIFPDFDGFSEKLKVTLGNKTVDIQECTFDRTAANFKNVKSIQDLNLFFITLFNRMKEMSDKLFATKNELKRKSLENDRDALIDETVVVPLLLDKSGNPYEPPSQSSCASCPTLLHQPDRRHRFGASGERSVRRLLSGAGEAGELLD